MERINFGQIPSGMITQLMSTENYLNDATFNLKFLELIRLRVAQINKCAYCVDMHYKELKHAGETELRLSSLTVWEQTTYFSDKERAILKYTDALTELSIENIPNSIYDKLTNFFNTEEICHLCLAVSHINTWTRLVATCKFTAGNYKVKK